MGIVISIVMAIIIGLIGNALTNNSMPGGVIGAMVAGFVGAWLGNLLFGAWGLIVAGFAVLPAIIGAALFIFLISLIFGGYRNRTA